MTTDFSPTAHVATNVRQLRNSNGWTLADLSEQLDTLGWTLTVQTLSKLETGARATSVDDLHFLSVAFGVSADDLLAPPAPSVDSHAATVLIAWRARATGLVEAMNTIAHASRALRLHAIQEQLLANDLYRLVKSGEIEGDIDDLVPTDDGPLYRDRHLGFDFGDGVPTDDTVIAFIAKLVGATNNVTRHE